MIKKTIAMLVALSFLFSNIVFADTPKNTGLDAKKQTEVIVDPERIVVPRDYGLIKSRHTAKDSKKLVIHIQDAHCNYEAQSNIIKILECLIKNDGLGLISVEGADGFIDTSWFKAFPDADIRKEVADYFMKKGEITGPEFLSITSDYPIKLFGAETRSYYIENLNAFTSSYPLKEDIEKYFNQIRAVLNRLKNYIYSDELKELDVKNQDYESKKLSFTDYVKYLESLGQRHKMNLRQYENLFKLVSVLVYEKKINFDVVDKERATLIDVITKKLEKEALTELVNKSLEFKVGKISSVEYYRYLRALAVKHGISMPSEYPNLFNYIIYNSVYSRIENEQLFNDIKKFEEAVKDKIFTNDDQRTLDNLSRHINILLGLVNIRLLNDDFDYYKARKDEFTHEIFSGFIRKMTERYGFAFEVDAPSPAVTESMSKLEDFYSIAIKRDKALVNNTIKAMKTEGVQVSVLVTGGFHSEGITKLLEKQGVSYIVVCPNITKEAETPYIKILTNQRTPLEEILSDTGVATADAKSVKSGMLAPYLITGARPNIGQLRNIKEIGQRAETVLREWATRQISGWLPAAVADLTKMDIQPTAGIIAARFNMDVDKAVEAYIAANKLETGDLNALKKSAKDVKEVAQDVIAEFLAQSHASTTENEQRSTRPLTGAEAIVKDALPAYSADAHVIVLTKPKDFQSRDALKRQYRSPAGKTTEERKQLKAIDSMWARFEGMMRSGKYFDAIVLSCSESRIEEEASFAESLRGIAYPEDTPVILISRRAKAGGPELDNLNALVNRLIAAREALKSLRIDISKGNFLFVQLTGKGTRNEPFNHSAGLGSKHRMLNSSGLDYLARTMVESCQFYTNTPGWTMRANDQIVLSTNRDIFKGRDQGYVIAGKKLPINAKGEPLNEEDRNNCFMRLDSKSTILKAHEKPNNEELRDVLPESPSEVNLIPASFFIRRFTPEAVNKLIECFSRPATNEKNKGRPLYQVYKMPESTMIIEAGTLSQEEWAKKRPGDVDSDDWESIRQASYDFRREVGTGFADLGDEGIFIDTGTNIEYFKAFMDTLVNPVLQAHMDVKPDKHGNVIVNCEFGAGIQKKIDAGEIHNIFAVNAKILSGKISSNSVLLNVVAKEVELGKRVMLSNVDERSEPLKVEEGYLYTTIWDKRNGEKVSIKYPISGDARADYKKPLFGSNRDISFSAFDSIQNKAKSSRLQKLTKLSLHDLFGPVLIIGGAGYVGSFVTEACKKEGREVVVYDNLYKGHVESLVPGVIFERGDIKDKERLKEVIERVKPVAVIHTSALSEVAESVTNPIMYYYYNTICTMGLLDIMAKSESDVKKIEFSSTAATYGEPILGEGQAITEDFPLIPINPYGNSKVMIERLLDEYGDKYGIISTRLRYFNVAGASADGARGEDHGPKDSHLIPKYLQALLSGGSIFMDRAHGKTRIDLPTPDGTAIRDYVHIVELAVAHVLALENMLMTGTSDVFNMGTEQGFSTMEVAEAIVGAIEANPNVPEEIRREVRKRFSVEGARRGDPARLVARNAKARAVLTAEFKAKLKTIIDTALEWHLKHPDGYGVPADSSALERNNDTLMDQILSELRSNQVISDELRFDILMRMALDMVNSRIAELEDRLKASPSDAALKAGIDLLRAAWTRTGDELKAAIIGNIEPLAAARGSAQIMDFIRNPSPDVPYLDRVASELSGLVNVATIKTHDKIVDTLRSINDPDLVILNFDYHDDNGKLDSKHPLNAANWARYVIQKGLAKEVIHIPPREKGEAVPDLSRFRDKKVLVTICGDFFSLVSRDGGMVFEHGLSGIVYNNTGQAINNKVKDEILGLIRANDIKIVNPIVLSRSENDIFGSSDEIVSRVRQEFKEFNMFEYIKPAIPASESQSSLQPGEDVGAIRANGGAYTAAEHGTRGAFAENIRTENSIVGVIADLILRGDAHSLLPYKMAEKTKDTDKALKQWQSGRLDRVSRDNLNELMSGEWAKDHNIVIVKGLKRQLALYRIVEDFILEPGIARNSYYIDESDFLYFLSLKNGVELMQKWDTHEMTHIKNPKLSEDVVEALAPSYDVRLAVLARSMSKREKANIDQAYASLYRDIMDEGKEYTPEEAAKEYNTSVGVAAALLDKIAAESDSGKIKKEMYELVMKNTPQTIKDMSMVKVLENGDMVIEFTEENLGDFNEKENPAGMSILSWFKRYAKEANVSTAGIRGIENILFSQDPRELIGQKAIFFATVAKALVAMDLYPGKELHKLAGSEVRYNSREFVEFISRIQASFGIKTHIAPNMETIPIWMASFLIFKYDLLGGEFVTSSHAISKKNATKDLTNEGSQYTPDESKLFIAKIKEMIQTIQRDGVFRLVLSKASDDLMIDEEFMKKINNGMNDYVEYLKEGVATPENLDLIKRGNRKIYIDVVGGSMYRTMSKIFEMLGITDRFNWLHKREDPFFHGIGKACYRFNTEKGTLGLEDLSCDTSIVVINPKGEVGKIVPFFTDDIKKTIAEKPMGTQILTPVPNSNSKIMAQIRSVNDKAEIERFYAGHVVYIELNAEKILVIETDKKILPVIRTMGYKKSLSKEKAPVGTVIELTDPDGDRLITAQIVSTGELAALEKLGVAYDILDQDRAIAVFMPNQSFLMTVDFRREMLKRDGQWTDKNWFMLKTTASAAAWDDWSAAQVDKSYKIKYAGTGEWKEVRGIPVVNTPVGFKELATVMRKVEKQMRENPEQEVIIEDIFGNQISLGVKPHLLFAGEESGGEIFGSVDTIKSVNGREAIAMREKSAGEAMVITSAMASEHESLIKYLEDIYGAIRAAGINLRQYDYREDVIYFNESEPDPRVRAEAEKEGIKKKEVNEAFYLAIAIAIKEGKTTFEKARTFLQSTFPAVDFEKNAANPSLQAIEFVGDGIYLRFADRIIEVRPSGTEAKTKGYALGPDLDILVSDAKVLGGYYSEDMVSSLLISPENPGGLLDQSTHDRYFKWLEDKQMLQIKAISLDIYNEYLAKGSETKPFVPPSDYGYLSASESAAADKPLRDRYVSPKNAAEAGSAATFDHTIEVIMQSSNAGEHARKIAENLFKAEEARVSAKKHLILVKSAIPSEQLSTTTAINYASYCADYYNRMEGYTADIVDDYKGAVNLLAKNPDWDKTNTIVGLIDKQALDNMTAELKENDMQDKTKLLPIEAFDKDQFIPLKGFFDLMSVLVGVNRPLDRPGDQELKDAIRDLLNGIGVRDVDQLIGVLSTAEYFEDPVKFAKNFILKLLPPVKASNPAELREKYNAAKKVVESL